MIPVAGLLFSFMSKCRSRKANFEFENPAARMSFILHVPSVYDLGFLQMALGFRVFASDVRV